MSTRYLGSTDVVAFALPAHGLAGAWDALVQSAQSGQILILDVTFVERTASGIERLFGRDIVSAGGDAVIGAQSGILSDGDLALATASLPVGGRAVVVLKETLTFAPVIDAFERDGAQFIAEIPVFHEDLAEELKEDHA
ncbi:MAG: hypothetical protein LKK46_07235 [Ancrocorticia sp.]|nr:hypothetical protein [Ancrocorticia sp.]MCI2193902.1 hypothetical protein [Ancrocorticia sp.]